MWDIANFFSNSVEDGDYKFARIKSLRNNDTPEMPKTVPSFPQVVTIDNNRTSKQNDERRSAHNVSQRLCKEEKFTGKIGEGVFEYVSNYEEASGD